MSKRDERDEIPAGLPRATLEMLPAVRRGQREGASPRWDAGLVGLRVVGDVTACARSASRGMNARWSVSSRSDCSERADRVWRRAAPCLSSPPTYRLRASWSSGSRKKGQEPNESLAIDGKALLSLHGDGLTRVHQVAAFAHHTRVVLAQAKTRGKGHIWASMQAIREPSSVWLLTWQVVLSDALLASRARWRPLVRNGGASAAC